MAIGHPGRRGESCDAHSFRLVHEGDELVVLSLPVTRDPAATLSPAETEVARALVRGATNADIARLRGTSVRTVANQVASILRRLGVGSRAQVAVQLSLIDSSVPEEGP
jgi:DNA-binding NarL/FixJ family response regulator